MREKTLATVQGWRTGHSFRAAAVGQEGAREHPLPRARGRPRPSCAKFLSWVLSHPPVQKGQLPLAQIL